MDKDKVNQILNKVIFNHQRNVNIETFCVVGSFINKSIKIPHDVDCLVLTNKKLSERYLHKLILSSIRKTNVIKSDDSFRITIDNIQFGFVYFDIKSFYKEVNSIMNGIKLAIESKPWVIGGKIPEILLTDILSAKVIFDKKGIFVNLQKTLKKEYPKNLRMSLINELKNELLLKINSINDAIVKNDVLRVDIGIGELLIVLVRLIYGQKRVYLIPIKHLSNDFSKFEILKRIVNIPKLPTRKRKMEAIKEITKKIINNSNT